MATPPGRPARKRRTRDHRGRETPGLRPDGPLHRDAHMKTCITGLVLLLGLPTGAVADTDAEIAQCASAAQQFATAPRAMSIGDLDAFKTCINSQRDLLLGDEQRRRIELERERRLARASLRDDF